MVAPAEARKGLCSSTASSDTVVARATVVVFLPAEPGEARELRRRFPLMSHGRQPKLYRAKSTQVAISQGSA